MSTTLSNESLSTTPVTLLSPSVSSNLIVDNARQRDPGLALTRFDEAVLAEPVVTRARAAEIAADPGASQSSTIIGPDGD